jgi:hypothetical protein
MPISFFLTLLVLTLAVLPLTIAVAVPVVVYRRVREMDGRHYSPVGWKELPVEAAEFFSQTNGVFGQVGFRQVGLLHRRESPLLRSVQFMLLSNRDTAVTAIVVHWFNTTSAGVKKRSMVMFETELQNGIRVITTNTETPRVLASDPSIKGYRLPQIKDLFDVYCAHRRLLDQDFNNWSRKLSEPEFEVSDFQARTTKVLENQVVRGMIRATEVPGVYRPTAKGTVLMSWRVLKPLVNRNRQQRRIAGRLLKEIQMEGRAET